MCRHRTGRRQHAHLIKGLLKRRGLRCNDVGSCAAFADPRRACPKIVSGGCRRAVIVETQAAHAHTSSVATDKANAPIGTDVRAGLGHSRAQTCAQGGVQKMRGGVMHRGTPAPCCVDMRDNVLTGMKRRRLRKTHSGSPAASHGAAVQHVNGAAVV